ncbi:S26 family signal peptidase [Planctellipticum variicoloris]|uniref:S26 family signal peptidase n=1 Tax=Planctellipticum variicoloris TaxID=3064265 RepID=UPI003013CD44|nr:S26 family signal peptidase [Planctomycetaceae bacterium SH412]
MRNAVQTWWQREGVESPGLLAWLAALFPGCPQFCNGDRGMGLLFLGGFLGMAFAGLLLFGTTLGSIALGLALACHQGSLYDFARTVNHAQRFRLTALLVAFVLVAAYVPAWSLISARLGAIVLNMDTTELLAGDALIVLRQAYSRRAPAVEDLVLYRPDDRQLNVRQGYNIRLREQMLDRILATSGQSISVSGGRLLVDGLPAKLPGIGQALPLQDAAVMRIPPGRVLILPTAIMQARVGPRMEIPTLNVAEFILPTAQIEGRVFLRHRPWLNWRQIGGVEER